MKRKPKKDSKSAETIVVCGLAKLPGDCLEGHVAGYIHVELEINRKTTEILDFAMANVTGRTLVEQIIRKALIGQKLKEGVSKACKEIEERIYCKTKKAMIAAFENLVRHYEYFIERKDSLQDYPGTGPISI